MVIEKFRCRPVEKGRRSLTDNFIIAVNTVLPMFIMIFAGVAAKRLRFVSEATAAQANGLCFRLFTSVMLFRSIYISDFSASFNPKLVLFCVCGILAEFLIGFVLVMKLEKQNSVRSVVLQALFRTNVVLFAIPMYATLFGAEHAGEITLITAVTVPLVNVLAVVDLELFRGGRPDPVKILRGIAVNPLVLGALLGIAVLLTGIRLPQSVESAVNGLANAATPLALVLLGASLNFRKFAASFRSLTFSVVMRLLVLPAVCILLAILFGFRGTALGCVLLIFAPPVAVASYPMAAEMGGDADLAAEIVVLSTALSGPTLFLWIWLLKTLALF